MIWEFHGPAGVIRTTVESEAIELEAACISAGFTVEIFDPSENGMEYVDPEQRSEYEQKEAAWRNKEADERDFHNLQL